MKILGIGLGRTATQSLAKALEILGYRAKHCPQFYLDEGGKLCVSQKDVEQFEALTDEPCILIYRQVDRQYPGSKFILTVREMESWLRSVENNGNALREWRAQFPTIPVLHRALYGTATFDRGMFTEAHRKHVEDVKEYLADRPQDLLVMDICAGDGWEKVCRFLGKPIPEVAFPRLNVFGESDWGTMLKRGGMVRPRAQASD
ncbi:MAG: hypothetical protein ISS56_04150 [Anaerolineae bacterium]|nr:hypothetical protein [Anaerolineae bacterium]